MHIGEYTQRRGHTKECVHAGEEEYTRRKNYTRRELNTDQYRWWSMEECTHGGVYTWRIVYMEEYTHGGMYTWRSVHTEECTHGGVYTWRSVYTRGRLNIKKNTYRKEYTQKRIYAGKSECGGRRVHTVECIPGGESTRGEHIWRST